VIGPEPEEPGPYSPQWAEASGAERLAEAGARHFPGVELPALQPGDVLLFRWRAGVPAKHLAVLVSPDTMVHAQECACVCEVALTPWWRRRIAQAFAFPD
jgi:NlpC/P60 family putative phage cell wall peptidase